MDPISDKLFKVIEAELPYREESGGYTKYGDWYGTHVDDSYSFKTAAWCDMFLAWAADQAGVAEYAGRFAYTPAHANWFRQQGAWSTTPEPGAFVFYNWSGPKSVGGISHVGIVEKVAGTKIHTIEGNADGVYLKRKVRDTGTVVGYGLPRLVKVDGATYEQTLAAAATPAATPPPAVAATPAASAPAPEPTAASAAPASPGSALSPMSLGAGRGRRCRLLC
ncbi:CHAP domain-containing protein [Nonomuraea sp. NPDC050310]|uniref:CHAP domain-containing protein n=1 Tax=Nonomuraea sp. NPDC050310 TaxID=3154935 RepID=UPI0033EB063D